jgi:hypothetical protein
MSRTACVVLSLLLVCPSVFAQKLNAQSSPRALLKVFGEHVRVNGQPVSDVTTVFNGDRIDTGSDSAVSLVETGRTLSLNQNSSATFRDGSLISSGGNVSTSSGTATVVGSVSPSAPCPISRDKPGNGPKCKK